MTIVPHVFCSACGSPLVQASDWEQGEASSWYVCLWCPECGFERPTMLDAMQAASLSQAIEAGFAGLLETLEELQALCNPNAGPDARGFDFVERILAERTEPLGQ